MAIEPGQKFNLWEVVAFSHYKSNAAYFRCRCVCGHEAAVNGRSLVAGKSGGCMPCRVSQVQRARHGKPEFHPGDRFGRLTILSGPHHRDAPRTRRYYMAVCDCGVTCEPQSCSLFTGNTRSCGCVARESKSERMRKHGFARIGERDYLYNRWKSMRQRCNDPGVKNYHRYGGRGITICPEWDDYGAFHKWSCENGYRRELELDRIDNDAGYSPGNCRWVSQTRNVRNSSRSRLLSAWGENKPVTDWADDPRAKVGGGTIRRRIDVQGWDVEKAISTPLNRNGSRFFVAEPEYFI